MRLATLAGGRSHGVLKARLNIGRLNYMDQLHLDLHFVCNFMALDKHFKQHGTGEILYVIGKYTFLKIRF